MPDELSGEYYAESSLIKGKDDEILMSEKLIIMDDELSGKDRQQAIRFNDITSKQYFYLRRPYGDSNEKVLRLSVLGGTSNHKGIINDPAGNRRAIPIEVNDVDKEAYNKINKKDLFMEMFKLYKEGFDWRINKPDIVYLNENEEDYEVVVKERELIVKYFEPGDDPVTTTDIIVEIELLTRQKLSLTVVAKELIKLGFLKKSCRNVLSDGSKSKVTCKRWFVKRIGRFNTIDSVMIVEDNDDAPF
jgi:predicted P-loop ATPase